MYGYYVFCYCKAHSAKGPRYMSSFGLTIRTIYVVFVILAAALFGASQTTADTLDYCGTFHEQGACDAFLRNESDITLCAPSQSAPIRFRCRWHPYTFTPTQQVLLPPIVSVGGGVCRRSECQLYENSLSIAAEYAAMFLPLTYLVTYGLADLTYLSDSGGLVRSKVTVSV